MLRRVTKEIFAQVITHSIGKWNPDAKHDLHAAKAASVLMLVPTKYWQAGFRASLIPTRIALDAIESATGGSRYVHGTSPHHYHPSGQIKAQVVKPQSISLRVAAVGSSAMVVGGVGMLLASTFSQLLPQNRFDAM